MENFVITIARQYGSGGRTVGKMLAEKLGVSFYDKQIIQMASDESGIDVKLFGQVEEGSSVKASLFNKTGLYKVRKITSRIWTKCVPFSSPPALREQARALCSASAIS